MAGHSRPEDGVTSFAYVLTIHALLCCQDVDARTRPGIDVLRLNDRRLYRHFSAIYGKAAALMPLALIKNAQARDVIRNAFSRISIWANKPRHFGWERAGFMIFLALAIVVRIPKVWTQGRFWAEEGRVFFQKAWHMPWWEALLAPHAGYLNLVGNASALLAAYLTTLRTAPYVTSTIGLVIQCVPILLLSTSHDKWLKNRLAVVIASAVILCPPVPEEVWANSADSHFHLALCAGVILAIETQSGAMGKFHGCVLLLAALSGPGSWALIPLYALRAVLERSKPRALQGFILLLGAIIQLTFFASFVFRDGEASPSMLGAVILAKHVITPLLGHSFATAPIADLRHQFDSGNGPIWPLALVLLLFAIALFAAASLRTKATLWLLLASAVLACASYGGSLGQKVHLLSVPNGERYQFAPQVLIGLALLSWTISYPGRLRLLSGVLLAWIVGVGEWNYFVPDSDTSFEGPVWPEQVAQWERDPDRPLQIWPSGWTMKLSAK